MRYAFIVGCLSVVGSFASAGEPASVLVKEPTPAVAAPVVVSENACAGGTCRLQLLAPRRTVTHTRSVTKANACGEATTTENSRTRTWGGLLPRRAVRSTCTSCNCN